MALDSPTAVRTLNALMDDGLTAKLAMTSFTTPSGRLDARRQRDLRLRLGDEGEAGLGAAGRNDVWFYRTGGAAPGLEPIDRKPQILVLTGALDQDVGR